MTEIATNLILVVDDDEIHRMLIATALTEAGYVVVLAENGCDALALYGSMHPAIVITDIQMPVRNGLDLISDLRQINLTIPIVAMSGGSPELLEKAKKLGANQGIAKGGSMVFMLSRVESLLNKW
jgi:CheY-like chemotaxis protein